MRPLHSHRLFLGFALVAPAALAGSHVALAEPPSPTTETDVAKQLRIEAAAAAEKKDWDTCRSKAAAAFREAKQPQSAGLWGLCDAEVQAYRDAAEHLDYAIRFDPDEKRRARYDEPFKQATSHVGAIDVTTEPDGGEVLLDGKPVGQAPLTLFVNPGHYRVEARKTGRVTFAKELDVVVGARPRLVLPLADEPAGPKGGTGKGGLPLWPGPIALGIGATLVGIGGGLFALHESQREDAVALAKGRRCGGADACSDVADAISTANASGNAGIGLVTAGSVVAAGGLALLIASVATAPAKEPVSTATWVVPQVSPSSAGLTVFGSF